MQLALSTILAIPAPEAWQRVQTSALLQYVSAPVLAFTPLEPASLPQVWADRAYRVRMALFGLLPLGSQWIDISRPTAGPQLFQLRDAGRGSLVRRWDHLISIEALTPGSCRYTERVEVEAGVLTPFIWAFAQLFYRHRQRRWRKLAGQQERLS